MGVDSQTTEMVFQTHLSATPHPSKHLHDCSRPPGSFSVPGSPGHLPSCFSLSENSSTSGLSSAARVREVLRCCHLVPRTSSLGFSFKLLWVDFFSSGDPRGARTLFCVSIERIQIDSPVSNPIRTALTVSRRRKTKRVAGPFSLFLSFPIGKVRWTAEMVTKMREILAAGGHA